MSAVATLLSHLRNAHRQGDGWRADCPNGHDKTRGSLAIAEGDDGRVLLTCFACHDTPGILAALGLSLADLFPDRPRDASPAARAAAFEAFRRSAWGAALGVLSRESRVVQIAGADVSSGSELSATDAARVALACQRIDQAREVLT